jgi:hypothetical protein
MADNKQIFAALVKAQRAFGPALKDRTNPAFKSKYADLGSCIDAVQDALNSNGIALVQSTREDSTGVTVETLFLHESGESFASGPLHVPASKQDPQGYGSALTYARRYSLMAACGIAPEDDDGNAASNPGAAHRPANGGPADMSPKARAQRIMVGVAGGDAKGAALAMSEWPKATIDAVWAHLDELTQNKLTEAWPA